MTDKEILAEVYRRLQGMASVNTQPIKDFIELEWQKQDDQGLVDQYNRNRKPEDHITDAAEIEAKDEYGFSKDQPHFKSMCDGVDEMPKKWYTDVRDMERHRGLEIGPDGTVISLD